MIGGSQNKSQENVDENLNFFSFVKRFFLD